MAQGLTMPFASTILACMLAANVAPPLGVAALTPPDVDAVVQVRGNLQDGQCAGACMLRRGVQTLLSELGARQRWEAAAAQAHLSPDELLRRCAGRDASLVVRRDAGGPSWVLALEMASQDACDLLRAMGGRMRGNARFEIPQLGLVGGLHGDWLLITDRAESRLLKDMLRVGSEPEQPSLASGLGTVRMDDDAVITVALRHDRIAKGLSVWGLSARGTGMHVQMRARLQGDPMGATVRACEPAMVLEAMPEETVACWMQDMPVHAVPHAWSERLAAWNLDTATQDSLGDRLAVVVGPADGEEESMAVAVAYRVRDAKAATRAQDAMLDRVAAAIAHEAGHSVPKRPSRTAMPVDAPRTCDEPGLAQAVFGNCDGEGDAELHARTVVVPSGGWRVYASDRQWLDRVAASLEEHPEPCEQVAGAPFWTHAGHMHGDRLARMIEQQCSTHESRGGCAKPARLLAACLRQAGTISWRMAQPEPGSVEMSIELQPSLAPVITPAAPAQLAERVQAVPQR